jgi:hypothetical protein
MKPFGLFTLLLIILLPFYSMAGWIITGRTVDDDGITVLKRYFIDNNHVKVERYNLIYSCNLKTGEIILVDPENLVYCKTSLLAYTQKMRDIKLSRLADLLTLLPEDQRSEYEKTFKAQVEKDVNLPESKGDSLVFNKLADTLTMLGHHVNKYELTENGKKREDIFFTNEVDITADIDIKTFLKYAYLIEPEDKTIRYMATNKYLDFITKGLIVRKFVWDGGPPLDVQVNLIEHKNIPDYEFGIPDLCKSVTLDKWLTRSKDIDDKYYDDYE